MDSLSDLFQQLDERIKSDDHSAAVEVCDQILAAAPGDTDALHVKVCSLIELSKTEEALQVIESSPGLAGACTFEHGYCLYALHREDEALELLMPGGATPEAPRDLQLAGQILYRKGEAARAADLFKASESAGGPSTELSTNILAALVSAGAGAEALEYAKQLSGAASGGADTPGFELYYNRACAAISVGQLERAQELLGRAIELCRETLSADDYSEEEIEVELGVLTAQAAYVNQSMGDIGAAEKAYQTLFAFKTDLEPNVAAVAANNMLQIRGQHDLFDSWKKCKSTLSSAVAKKLTPAQRLAFLSNAALLALHMNKPDPCKEMIATLTAEFPDSEAPLLMRAALLLRAKQQKQCEEVLEAAAAAPSGASATALLTLAQLQLQAKDVRKAVSTLGRIGALQNTPGMVGTLVALHERLGEVDQAAKCFDGAMASGDVPLMRASADFFARHGRWTQAAAAHSAILASNSRDLKALAGVVIATSYYDPALANEHYARLEGLCPPPEETGADDIDATQLEQMALPKGSSRAAGARDASDRKRGAVEDAEGGSTRRKKRRRRKRIIYPKGFDPANPGAFPQPDPERWLPKRERSTYRQRKKDKRAGISRGPQGSATGAARVDMKATTNIQTMTDAERAKMKADEEAKARAEAAASAAAAASSRKKGKGKAKAKW